MKSLKFKRNLLIFLSYVITIITQITCVLYTHSFSLITFIGLATLNAFVVNSIKNNYDGCIYVEENWLKK